MVEKREPIISKLSWPLEARVEAAHYLAQSMVHSRKPGPTVKGLNFFGEGDSHAVLLFCKSESDTDGTPQQGHEDPKKAAHDEWIAVEKASDESLVRPMDLLSLGSGPNDNVDDLKDSMLGTRTAQWKPR